jgi:hypothetical protein
MEEWLLLPLMENVVAMKEEFVVGLSQDFDQVINSMYVDVSLCIEDVIPTLDLGFLSTSVQSALAVEGVDLKLKKNKPISLEKPEQPLVEP